MRNKKAWALVIIAVCLAGFLLPGYAFAGESDYLMLRSGPYSYSVWVNGENTKYDAVSAESEQEKIYLRGLADPGDEISIAVEPQQGFAVTGVRLQYSGECTYDEKTGRWSFRFVNGDEFIIKTEKRFPVIVLNGDGGTVTTNAQDGYATGALTITAEPDEDHYLEYIRYSIDDGESWERISAPSGTLYEVDGDAGVKVSAVFGKGREQTISTAEELLAFAKNVSAGNCCYRRTVRLGGDMALKGKWIPAGDMEHPFYGTFEGNGHSISGIALTETVEDVNVCYGLFGRCEGAVRDVTVEGTMQVHAVKNNSSCRVYAAGIAGYSGGGSFRGCVSRVDISVSCSEYAEPAVGGIVGAYLGHTEDYQLADTTMADCANYGNLCVSGFAGRAAGVGGIAGDCSTYDSTYTFERCANYGTIEATAATTVCGNRGSVCEGKEVNTSAGNAGGIVGIVSSAEIRSCCNKGDMGLSVRRAGGLAGGVGQPDGTLSVTDSYMTGTITFAGKTCAHNTAGIGGIVGANCTPNGPMPYGAFGGVSPDYGTYNLQNCYHAGSIRKSESEALYTDFTFTDPLALLANGELNNSWSQLHDGEIPEAVVLGTAFQEDSGMANGGLPLLVWENTEGDETEYTVGFETNAEQAVCRLYYDSACTKETPASDGVFKVRNGRYYYAVSAEGYMAESGSVNIAGSDKTVVVTLVRTVNVSILAAPGASIVLKDSSGETVFAGTDTNGRFSLPVKKNTVYTCYAEAEGYVPKYVEFTSSEDAVTELGMVAVDDGNAGSKVTEIESDADYHVTEPGRYFLKEGFQKDIIIDTQEPVTIYGMGVAEAAVYEDIHIKPGTDGICLILQDLYISNTEQELNLLGVTGKDNNLIIEGDVLLDFDYGFTSKNDALIHVGEGASLTISGAGTLYQYNCTQGAGIGGNTGEMNGDITFAMSGQAFIKGTRQGAVIGAGAGAKNKGTPGSIIFRSGQYNFLTNSRGAVIGGSAGANGASSGTNVYIYGGTLSLNVDFTGAAIGGGGYDSGNDAPGGTVYIEGGSVRTYIDKNAASNEHGGFNDVRFTEGVNDAIITAERLNKNGEKVYKCVFDTEDLSGGPYEIQVDGKAYYKGGRHEYSYINDSLSRNEEGQIGGMRTTDNWIPNEDPNLYFYLTGEDHTITVGDRIFRAVFDDSLVEKDGSVKDNRIYTTGAFTVQEVVPQLKIEDHTQISDSSGETAGQADVTFEKNGTDFTVEAEQACAVLLRKADGTLETLDAKATDDSKVWRFTADGAADGDTIVIALKGDGNLDGKVNSADVAAARAVSLHRTDPDALQTVLLDVNGDEKINSADAAALKAVSLGKRTASWQ